jgi:hypothetical protein
MTIGKLLATTRINFYDSDDVSKRKLLAFGSHTKAVNKAWEACGGVRIIDIYASYLRSAREADVICVILENGKILGGWRDRNRIEAGLVVSCKIPLCIQKKVVRLCVDYYCDAPGRGKPAMLSPWSRRVRIGPGSSVNRKTSLHEPSVYQL